MNVKLKHASSEFQKITCISAIMVFLILNHHKDKISTSYIMMDNIKYFIYLYEKDNLNTFYFITHIRHKI